MPRSRRTHFLVGFFLAVIFCALFWAFRVAATALPSIAGQTSALLVQTTATTLFTQEDLAALVKPGVVRLYHEIRGDFFIPEFSINIARKAFSLSGKIKQMPVDSLSRGSGLLVTPTGYIITNAHVVLPDFERYTTVQAVLTAYLEKTGQSTDSLSEQENLFLRRVEETIAEKTVFHGTNRVVVARSLPVSDVETAFREGIPAVLKKADNQALLNYNDVALLKIEGNELPSIGIVPGVPEAGGAMFVFGYPATGDAPGALGAFEPTVSAGVLSGTKENAIGTFALYQTDAKAGSGSSGGPVFGPDGRLYGIIALNSKVSSTGLGDTFGFAIPVEKVQSILGDTLPVEAFVPSSFETHFKNGVELFHSLHCKEAIAEFQAAGTGDSRFPVGVYTRPYIDQCAALVVSGGSVDSAWGSVKQFFRTTSTGSIVIFFILFLVLIGLGWLVYVLTRRMRKSEAAMKQLEERLQPPVISETEQKVGGVAELTQYIHESRTAGVPDADVRHALIQAGWNESLVAAAFLAAE